MAYQKCPLCEGLGEVPVKWISSGTSNILPQSEVCPVCLGTRIINEDTGLPPGGEVLESFEDFKETLKEGKVIQLWPEGPPF